MCPINRQIILMDIVLACVINTSAMLLGGAALSFFTWYPGTSSALATNILVQLTVPVPRIARCVSGNVHSASIEPWVRIFVENLIYVTIISFTMALIQTGGEQVVSAWLSTYVQLTFIGYATSMVLFHISNTFTERKESE